MTTRRIEERAEFPNGIKTEWEPTRITVSEKEARQTVIDMNRKAKAQGSFVRYRSVEEK